MISLFGLLSLALLSFIPGKIRIREMFAAAYAQQQQAISDPLFDSKQIAQSLYSISIQDLLMILGITALGCILVFLIVNILLNRTKVKE